MLKIEPSIISEGFGDGSGYGQGEYLFSSGMKKSQNGLSPNWQVFSKVDNSTLPDLSFPLQWMAQAAPGGVSATFGIDGSGHIYKWDGSNWTEFYKPSASITSGNGLGAGPDGNLYYKGDRYLGRYDGTTDYTTGTISVTNGSPNVVGSGTTFTSGMVGKRIAINNGITIDWYTISAFTDATHITLSTNYTAGNALGIAYAIKMGFTDQFQDFTTSVSNTFCPIETYEDTVLVAHGKQIGSYSVTTSTFTADAFDLPSNITIRALKSGRNGILISGNIGNRSVRMLWDNQALRSISPWIWSNENVQAIEPWNGNWIVTTNRRILISTGYYESELTTIPDAMPDSVYISCFPQGTAVIGNYFFIANSSGVQNRIRSGVRILNLLNLKWEYAPTLNNVMMNNVMGAIFFDSAFTIHLSWQTANPSKTYIGILATGGASRAEVISAPVGASNSLKTAQGLRLSLGMNPTSTDSRTFSLNVAVKVANTKRILFGFGQSSGVGPAANKITVNGTLTGENDAQIGDEITVMEGANAGQTAHITAIANQNTTSETWTLDTNLSQPIESGIFVAISPFRLMSKQSITNATQLKDLLFTSQKAVEGRKFFVKIVFDGITNTPPELFRQVDFIYDDLGEI